MSEVHYLLVETAACRVRLNPMVMQLCLSPVLPPFVDLGANSRAQASRLTIRLNTTGYAMLCKDTTTLTSQCF
jgi:hypothetical protein